MTFVRFRSHNPDGIEALVVCLCYPNAKDPERGPEDRVRGVLLASCISAGLVLELFHPLYLRGQLRCIRDPCGKEVGPAALPGFELE